MGSPDIGKILKLTKDLVSIDSRIGNEKELTFFLKEHLEMLGLKTSVHGGDRPNLYAFQSFSEEGDLFVLNGHLDTVEPENGWDEPFCAKQKGDWLTGLGTADMKSGIACIISATESILDHNDLHGTLALSFVSDEEGHGNGARLMMTHPRLQKAKGILIAEPFFGTDTGIPLGMTGKVLYRITVKGRKAHAFRPNEGINAIEDAAKIIGAIEQAPRNGKLGDFPFPEDPDFGKASFCPLKIEGGYKVYNVSVPEQCNIILNRLILPHENQVSVIEDLKNLIENLAIHSEVEIELIPPYYHSYKIPKAHQLVQDVSNSFNKVMGFKPRLSYDQMITDANIFMGEHHIPTIVFGPHGKDLHSKDEGVHVPSLVPTTEIIKETIEKQLARRS